MRIFVSAAAAACLSLPLAILPLPALAKTVYWNIINSETFGDDYSAFLTYDTLADMLSDSNRKSVTVANGTGSFGKSIVDAGSDGTHFWSLMNAEGESDTYAAFFTYGSFGDMLSDSNRASVTVANGTGSFGKNIVGTGSDGTTYWNLVNSETFGDDYSAFFTYSSLADMLSDSNRQSVSVANGTGSFGKNIVGTGSDGTTYWNLMNAEGESDTYAAFFTYGSLADMMSDSNRQTVTLANGTGSFGKNIVGTGAWVIPDDPVDPAPVPLPASMPLLAGAVGLLGMARRYRKI